MTQKKEGLGKDFFDVPQNPSFLLQWKAPVLSVIELANITQGSCAVDSESLHAAGVFS